MFQIQVAERPQPVNVPMGPLVTPAESVVNPAATTALVNAMREGFITSQDIADRLGTLGQSQRAAEIQKSREIIDPKAIAARNAIRDSEAEKARLAGMEAQAMAPLVQQKADLTKAEMERKKAGLWMESGLKAYEETGRPPIFYEGTTEVDAEQTAALGAHMHEAKGRVLEATKMLQGELKQFRDKKTDQMIWGPVNLLGQDVSPGSDDFKAWSKKLHDAYDDYYYPPKIKPRPKPGTEAKVDKTAANKQKAQEVSAANAALVFPKKTPLMMESQTSTPLFSQSKQDADKEEFEILKMAEGRPTYQAWAEKLVPMESFSIAAKRIQDGPGPAEKSVWGEPEMRQLDTQLINSVKQLAVQTASSTSRAVPDFQTKVLEENVSVMEKLADWRQTLEQKGTLTPGTRQRLIQLGNDYIRSREKLAKEDLNWAIGRTGRDPLKFWSPESPQSRLLKGETMVVPEKNLGPHGATGAQTGGGQSGVITLPSKRKIVWPSH